MTGSVAEIVTPDSGVTKTSYPITDKPIGHPPDSQHSMLVSDILLKVFSL